MTAIADRHALAIRAAAERLSDELHADTDEIISSGADQARAHQNVDDCMALTSGLIRDDIQALARIVDRHYNGR